MKKFIPLFILTTLLTVSCSSFNDDSKVLISKNIDSFLLEKNGEFAAYNSEDIKAFDQINAGFALYFASEGCSACERFTPILSAYLKSTNMLTYKIDCDNKNQLNDIKNIFGKRLFGEDTQIVSPSLFVISKNSVDSINYDSYMKTQYAFENHMNSKYLFKNVFYSNEDVFQKQFDNKEFSQISFDYSVPSSLNLFESNLFPLVRKSEKNIVITNNQISNVKIEMTGKKNGEKFIKKEVTYSGELAEEIKEMI